eukprot:TRINITY_DN2741_c0_g1_i1.p1 TRINITY_DN2741_c0_g1~~TRINITY_DN2741_c0_g1_i1.p1  ORF type:complete len:1424 (+),score=488.80 TRINITY_DN2741_c0_g1_i1:31-4272(+)
MRERRPIQSSPWEREIERRPVPQKRKDPKEAKDLKEKLEIERKFKSSKARLMHDYQEVLNAKDIYTVSAAPLDNDIFIWHANIKGMPDTAYENAIFHLIIKFPKEYPNNPPEITLTETILHPNVFGNTLCLDILSSEKKEFSGWSSSYSVLSILLQLQAFLFVKPDEYIDFRDLKNSIYSANEHKCSSCEHRPLRPYPPFNKPESLVVDKESLKPLEIVKNSLICFYTRRTFEEEVLGVGVKVRTNRRTGGILSVLPTFDWVCNKAFMRYNVRKSSNNISFTHWLPIYINAKHAEKAFHLAKRSIAFISTGNVEDFQPVQALNLYCAVISSCIVQIMKQNIFASSKAIEFLYQMERMFIEFAIKYPEITEIARYKLQNFIKDPKERHKDSVASLGEFMCLLLVVPDAKWADLVKPLIEESLTRNAFWIVNNYPSLGEEVEKLDFTEEEINSRLSKCYSSSSIGVRFICFQKFLQTKLLRGEHVTSLKDIAQLYDTRYSFPEENTIGTIKKEIGNLFSSIVDYKTYFKYVELGYELTDTQTNAWLIASQKMAKEKGYFDDADVNILSDYEDIKNLNSPSHAQLIKETGELVGEENEVWSKLLKSKIWHYPPSAYHKKMLVEKGYSPKQQYLHLYLQQYIKLLPTHKDFKGFVQTLQLVKNDITELEINLINDNIFTSKSFYLNLLLQNLVNLKTLIIAKPSYFGAVDKYDGSYSEQMKKRTLIAICKGISKSSGKLEKLQILGYNIRITKQFMDTLSSNKCSNLRSLNIDGFTLNHDNLYTLKFSQFLEKLNKNLTELSLSNFTQTIENSIPSFPLTNLQSLTLNNLTITADAFSSLFGHLSTFKSLDTLSLKFFNISSHIEYKTEHNLTPNERNDILLRYENKVRESFSKFISTSKSLTHLYFTKSNVNLVPSFHNTKRKVNQENNVEIEVNEDNFKHLFAGKSNSLKYVNLDGSTLYTEDFIGLLANYPSLQTLSLNQTKIDQYFHVPLPFNLPKGITLILPSLSPHLIDFVQKYISKIFAVAKEIDFKGNSSFFLELNRKNSFNKAISDENCALEILNLRKTFFSSADFRELCSHFEKNKSLVSLDLSKNQITANSCSFISNFLKVHPKLKVLSLFNNKVEVNGCRYLAEALKENPPLENLDIGSNKIKNKGIGFISSALSTNKNLKEISIRYNRVTGPTCLNFTASCIIHPTIEKISVSRNILADTHIMQIIKLIDSPFQQKNPTNEISENISDMEISTPKDDGNQNSKKRKNKSQSIDPKRKVLVSESKKKKLITDLDGYLDVLDVTSQERTAVVPDVPSHITPFFLKSRIEEEKCGVVENIQIFHKTAKPKPVKKFGRRVVSRVVETTGWVAFVKFVEPGSIDRLLHIYHKRIDLFRSKKQNEEHPSQQGTMTLKVDRSKKKVNKNSE